jgi:hypothetical protein
LIQNVSGHAKDLRPRRREDAACPPPPSELPVTCPTALREIHATTYATSPRIGVRLAAAASALLAAGTAVAGVHALALHIVRQHHAPSVQALEAPRCGPVHPDA